MGQDVQEESSRYVPEVLTSGASRSMYAVNMMTWDDYSIEYLRERVDYLLRVFDSNYKNAFQENKEGCKVVDYAKQYAFDSCVGHIQELRDVSRAICKKDRGEKI